MIWKKRGCLFLLIVLFIAMTIGSDALAVGTDKISEGSGSGMNTTTGLKTELIKNPNSEPDEEQETNPAFDSKTESVADSEIDLSIDLDMQIAALADADPDVVTFNDAVNITLENQTLPDNPNGRLFALGNSPTDWDKNYTYIYNAPVTVTIKNCSAQSFSLIQGEEWDKYIFNSTVTINVESSTFRYFYGLRDISGFYAGNYKELYQVTQLNGDYNINMKDCEVKEYFNSGVYKKSVYAEIPKKLLEGTINGTTNIHLDNTTCYEFYAGHRLEQSTKDPATETVKFGYKDINVSLVKSKLSIFSAAFASDFMLEHSTIDGNITVTADKDSSFPTSFEGRPSTPTGTSKGVVSGKVLLDLDGEKTISNLSGVDELHVSKLVRTSNLKLPPSDKMGLTPKNIDSWSNNATILRFDHDPSEEGINPMSKVYQGWTSTTTRLGEDTMGDTQLWRFRTITFLNVNFRPNGGTAVTTPVQVEYNTPVTEPVTSRTSHTLKGWYRNDGITKWNFDDGVIVPGMWLTAQWTPNPYTLHFDPNGGEGSMASYPTLGGESWDWLPRNTFTKAGYHFTGWSSTAGGTKEFVDGDSFNSSLFREISPNDNITLYALWEANDYTISFNSNGGVGSMTAQPMVYDTPANLSKNTFTKADCRFAGWSSTAGGGIVYTDKQEVSNLATSGNVTLYAVWANVNYQILYDSNGGRGSISPQPMRYNVPAKLSKNTFTKEGYHFLGWNTAPAGDVVYTDEQEVLNVTEDSDVTLYAIWEGNDYTITFHPNGGDGSMASQTMVYGFPKKLSQNSFTRAGYRFTGWSTTAAGDVAYTDEHEVSNLAVSGDVPLYAVWEISNYRIIYDANGGGGSMAPQSMMYNVPANLSKNTFTKEGYHFLGWSTAGTGNMTYTDEQEVSNLAIGGDVILFAVWQGNAYTVSFDCNGGEGSMAPQSMVYGQPKNLTENRFTKVGYDFMGWSTDKTGDVKYADKAEVLNLTTEGVATLYAVWRPSGNPAPPVHHSVDKPLVPQPAPPHTASSQMPSTGDNITFVYYVMLSALGICITVICAVKRFIRKR